MNTSQVDSHIRQSLDSLKDFQRATVDVVYDRLFNSDQSRMLVADEVGLGKTIVAKGIIARQLKKRVEAGDQRPLKVTYICSNQIIARENVRKLDIYPKQQSYQRNVDRISFLAVKPQSEPEGLLRLSTLTPGTSFRTGEGTGVQRERKLLYALLMSDAEMLAELTEGLACLLRGSVRKSAKDWWEDVEERRLNRFESALRDGLPERFLAAIRSTNVDHSEPLVARLDLSRPMSLYEAVFEYACEQNVDNFESYRSGSLELIKQLRKVLASLCIKYVDADLFILDEFQRFRDLIDEDKDSEAAIIARQIFSQPNARVLLLSATPFKAFTGNSEDDSGEEHYKEFRTVLKFLFQTDGNSLTEYEAHRQSLFKQLLSIDSTTEHIDTTHRDAVETLLRRVICRTERLSVSKDHDAMTWDKWRNEPVMPTAADVENFILADQLVEAMNGEIKRKADQLHTPVEFCKSAPYPLSFLDDYKLKRELKSRRSSPELHSEILARPNAWIDHQEIDTFSFVAGDNTQPFANARFSKVADEVLAQNAEQLLWVPPSLPYYPMNGAFEDSDGFSKTLVYSAWLMVPRMLATLLSYEVERRTIGHPSMAETHEQEERRYFAKKRHPAPQLVFRDENGPANMTNFTILYPSITLAECYDPVESLLSSKSISDLHSDISNRIRQQIEEANLEQYETESGEPSRWYWAAPLLLDKHNPDIARTVNDWMNRKERVHKALAAEKKQVGRAKALHLDQLIETFNDPANAGLGRMPEELPDVLAEIALGSPAVTAFRAFRRLFDGAMAENCIHAFSLANDFITLFNKAESIAAIRLSVPDQLPYWHRCIRYSQDGCVQAVLDEYLHLLRADCEEADEAISRLRASFNLRTVPLNVDDLDTFMNGKSRKLRCHFATELGNQRLETEQGGKRASNIRQVFNSPFRPFVLATTSIGQEGLDFHQYCRKIVHWNLPSNPIDLEQREGRINRFKGLVIRHQIADKYKPMLATDDLSSDDIWNDLFELAQLEREEGQSELIPFWHVETDKYKIERLVPFYPFSRDRAKLSSILKTLSIYRLAFGQPRQTELVEHLLRHVPQDRIADIRDKLMIDLSPISYGDSEHRPMTPVWKTE